MEAVAYTGWLVDLSSANDPQLLLPTGPEAQCLWDTWKDILPSTCGSLTDRP